MIGQHMVVQTNDWLASKKSANKISFRFREIYISIAIAIDIDIDIAIRDARYTTLPPEELEAAL